MTTLFRSKESLLTKKEILSLCIPSAIVGCAFAYFNINISPLILLMLVVLWWL